MSAYARSWCCSFEIQYSDERIETLVRSRSRLAEARVRGGRTGSSLAWFKNGNPGPHLLVGASTRPVCKITAVRELGHIVPRAMMVHRRNPCMRKGAGPSPG